MPSRLTIFIGIFFFSSCTNNTKKATGSTSLTAENKIATSKTDTFSVHTIKSNPQDTILLNSAIKEISSFPEIRKENKYIDSFSQGKHGIALLIDNPTKDEPYYSIHIGYNGKLSFETYNLFYVYIRGKSYEIRVNDSYNEKSDDGTSSVEEWRKNLKKSEH